MTPTDPPAPDLSLLLDRARAGDRAARDELFRAALDRLARLARRMLRKYPSVRRWADTGDVLANSAVRLIRALGAGGGDGARRLDTRGFFNLAAAVMRRELIDLARSFRGPLGIGANHASLPPAEGGPVVPGGGKPGTPTRPPWSGGPPCARRSRTSPPEDREVFGLTFYAGWTQRQIAVLFGVDERTVRRRWRRAAEALKAALGGRLPDD